MILAVIFWFLHRAKIIKYCPICLAVGITWIIGLILYYSDIYVDPLILAVLLGASLGALAQKYGSKYGLFWKTAFVILGIIVIYFLIYKEPFKAFLLLLLVAGVTFFFHSTSTKTELSSPLDKIENKFKDCC